jgi:predicted ATPase
MPSRRTKARTHAGAPFLRQVESVPDKFDGTAHPFNIPAFSNGIDLTFNSKVTFYVGENGSGSRRFSRPSPSAAATARKAAIATITGRRSQIARRSLKH